MTIGSAAFLPGLVPAAPLPSFQSFPPASLPSVAPPGRSPGGLATNDLPRGKILLVEPQAMVALDLQRILREAGYRVVGPASTVAEVERLMARGSIDCAVVDLDLDAPSAIDSADLLVQSGIPVVFLSGASLDELPERHRGSPLVDKPYTGATLLTALTRAISPGSDESGIWYPLSSPSISWPRVFPQL